MARRADRAAMKRRWLAAGVAVAALAVMLAGGPAHIRQTLGLPQAGDTLDLLSWNLGYGGLGAGSDFIADGGRNALPPSPSAVSDNIAAIVETLRGQQADFYILPEIARPSPLNYWHDLTGAVEKTLTNTDRLLSADVFTRFLPWPIRFEHGLALYARKHVATFEIVKLPLEEAQLGGLYQRAYSARVARLPVAGKPDWAIIGVHLAAFDKNGDVRRRQLAVVLALAEKLHAEGCPVVIGGDFNMTLVETNFPSTTSEADKFWVQAFPRDMLPAGWTIAADASTPSVRTNERPYKAGENFTAVVDGFIVSPGVTVERVQGVDLGFAHSDHQPVAIRVRRE
jgi:endonuclease/exonuclease/phosphatase family metal-dependent hydrolase